MDELEKQYQEQQRDAAHFMDWIEMGLERGWVSDPYCSTHEGPPITEYEASQFEEGEDPCIIEVRMLLIHDGPRYDRHADETRPE